MYSTKISNFVLKYRLRIMYLFHLRSICRRNQKKLKTAFEVDVSNPTFWNESEQRFFAPPKKVRYANDEKEIISLIRELTQHWTILSDLKENELFPLLKMLITTQTKWRQKERAEFVPGSVSDHVYEM